MKKQLFVIAVFIILFVPIIGFNKNGTISDVENRTLATKPLNVLNFAAYDNYFNDRFGGRNQFIKIANFIDYNIFKKQVKNSSAFKGKNGWFYFIKSGLLQDFYKKNLLSEQALSDFRNSVEKVSKWCKENEIKCLFVIAPNKHSVYPEFYIDSRPQGITRADQFVSVFNELGITYVFPRDYLIEQKKKKSFPLYYETDTHWNNLGAYLAFVLIQNEVRNLFPDTEFPDIEYDFSVSYSYTEGDLLPMLGVKYAKSTKIEVSPKDSTFECYFDKIIKSSNLIITKGKNDKLPKAVVFRDSFFLALIPYFSTIFSSVEYVHSGAMTDDDKNYIIKNKPDLIVFEMVERSAFGICGAVK